MHTSPRLKEELPSPFFGMLVALTLCVMVPLWVLTSTPEPTTTSWYGILLAAIIAGARFSWVIASSSRHLFEVTAWLYLYVFLGIAPLVQLRQQVDPGTTPNVNHAFDWTAVAIVLAAEVMLLLGTIAAGRGSSKAAPQRVRETHGPRASAMLFVTTSAAIVYIFIVGPSTLFLPRNDRNIATSSVFSDQVIRAMVSGFVSIGLAVAIIAYLQAQRSKRKIGERTRYLPAFLALIPLLVIVNPVGSARYVLLTVLLGLVVAVGAYSRIRRYRVISLMALGSTFLLFPLLDTFRRSLDTAIEASDPLDSLVTGDFDSFSQIVNTAHFVDLNGITWGSQFLGVLLFWVPRSLWGDKPVDTGILLADFKGYSFTNLSAPMPAEFFINGGWVALVAGMGMLGYLIRCWDVRSEVHIRAHGVPTVLGCVLPFYFVLILRGSLLQATSTLAVILAIWFITSKRASRAVDGSEEEGGHGGREAGREIHRLKKGSVS